MQGERAELGLSGPRGGAIEVCEVRAGEGGEFFLPLVEGHEVGG